MGNKIKKVRRLQLSCKKIYSQYVDEGMLRRFSNDNKKKEKRQVQM